MTWLSWWRSLGTSRKLILVAAVFIVLVLAVLTSKWALRDNYGTLFGNLEPQDVAALTTKLQGDHVPYRLGADGHSVEVPIDSIYSIRARLLEQGVTPRGGLGLELFEKADLGVTDFAQQVNYQRALQGELTRTITALEGVESARLHLVLPERQLFQSDQNQAKAAVTLSMRPGGTVTPSRVDGIRRLVASSVPGLKLENVAVHDERGNEFRNGNDTFAGMTGSQLEAKREIESYLETKAQKMMDAMFGIGESTVQVDATLNLDKVDTTRDEPITLPGHSTGAVLRTKATGTLQSNSSRTLKLDTHISSGLITEESNEDDEASNAVSSHSPVAHGRATAPTRETSTQETEYHVGRLLQRTNVAAGSISRVTAAVVVPASIGEQQLATIEDLVTGTLGLNVARGDRLYVRRKPVQAAATSPVAALGRKPSRSQTDPRIPAPYPLWLLGALGGLAFGVVVAMALRSRSGAKPLSAQERDQQLTRLRSWLSKGRETTA